MDTKPDYEQNRRARLATDSEYAARRRAQKRAANLADRQNGNRAARDAARKQLGQTYVTGKPCSRGHVGPRYAANQTCVECTREQQSVKEALRRERMKTDSVYYARRRAQKNTEQRARNKANRGKKAAEWAAWHAARLQRTPAWADLQAIRKFYEEAARLTKETGEPWHVDHEIPLNGKLVSGLHLAENLRVIQGIENLKKGAQFMQP